MSRIPKWKAEKAKVKVVFRLQFHATHIPQPGWDKLFVSFIPVDTGKVTAKTTKATVRSGNCKWSDPIYETTRLLQDTRSRSYDEKLYKLVVATGSSRSSLLGEVTINLADFADALKPSSVALPLHGCDYGTVLHATVQLLTSKTGFREFEQQRELSVKGFQTLSGRRSHDPSEVAAASLEMAGDQLDKVNNWRVRFKEDSSEHPSREEVGESNEYYEDSAAGIDGSSNTSESLNAEKNEISSLHEVDSLKSVASGDISALPAFQSPKVVKGDLRDIRLSKQGSNDWIHGWSSDYSADIDLSTANEENNRLRERLEGVEAAFLQLKTEAKSLQSLSDELGAETHSLGKQLVTELASGEKLATEVSILKSECYKFQKELEELKSATAMPCIPGNRTVFQETVTREGADALSTYHDSFSNQHQVQRLQCFFLLEEKVREIENKACLGYCGNDLDFLSSDFQILHRIIQNLKHETSLEVEETQLKEMPLTRVLQPEHFIHGQGLEGSFVGEHHLEGSLPALVNSHPLEKSITSTTVLEEKICELLQKLEESVAEKGILNKKMEQMECYYEALIHELEESRHQTVNELEKLRTEHSSCLYTISARQNQTDKLQQEMNEQFVRFAGDRHDLDSVNNELEKRAIASESALKRVRLNYAIAVDRLQKDLELLSFQVFSMYETNENLAKQALLDTSPLFPHQYNEKFPDEQYKTGTAKFQLENTSKKTDNEKSTMVNGISDQASNGKFCNIDIHRENKYFFERGLPRNVDVWTVDEGFSRRDGLKINDIETSSQLECALTKQEDHCKCCKSFKADAEAEISEMLMLIMHREVFVQVLKEAMHNVNDGVMHMKTEMVKLAQQDERSNSEKEVLMLKLHSAFDDARKSRKDEANFRFKCDDLLLKNQVLEEKIKEILGENNSLAQKVAEHESKYNSCLEEINEFEDMLKNESLQRNCLQSEVEALKEEFGNQSSANFELQKTISYVQTMLGDLCYSMLSVSEKIDGSTVDGLSLNQELESNNHMAIISHLERFQQEAYKKILQLRREKKDIEEDRDITHCRLNKTEEQILQVTQKFESDLEETRMKLDLSNALVEGLQLELQDVATKLESSLQAEEEHKRTNRELSTKLTILEIEVQQANDENREIAQKILEFDNVKEELKRTKINLMDCLQENRVVLTSLESGKVVSMQLENELSNLKDELKCAHDILHSESGTREELKMRVADLTLQMKEKDQQLLSSDEQKSELTSVRKRAIDLETEMQHFLLNSKEFQNKLDYENSILRLEIADLEYYLDEILDYAFSADVKVAYLRSQFQLETEELVDLNKALQGEIEELHLKHADTVASLKHHITTEAQLDAETRTKQDLNALVEKLQLELQDVRDTLKFSLEAEEKQESINKELTSKLTFLGSEMQNTNDENKDIAQRILEFENVKEELEKTKLSLIDCMEENKALMMSMESAKVVSIQLENELSILKDGLKCAHDNLHSKKVSKEELEVKVADVTLQLKERDQQLLDCEEQKSELIFVRKKVVDLETEMQHLQLNFKERQRKLDGEILSLNHQIADLKCYLVEILDHSLVADVRVTYLRCQFQLKVEELRDQNKTLQGAFEELYLKHTAVTASVEDHITTEAQLADENARLSAALQSVEAELSVIAHEKEGLLDYIDEKNSVLADFDDMKARAAMLEADNIRDKHRHEDETCQLKNMLGGLEEEVDNLQFSKIELETTKIILKSKLDEHKTHMSLLEECELELKRLREQHIELTYKLSEQILKTEEFKNLSIHLRELKDKAEAECLQSRERREAEGASLAKQDSLRIVFIKEQCESKLQEMKTQILSSKQYADEMVLKLQSALDEIETGKRSEASLAKRSDELSMKISHMEAELQSVVTDRRELAKAYDRMKAELECTILSLDCCKEEKLKLGASLQECNEERTRIRVELDLVKRLLENMVLSTADVEGQKYQPGCHSSTSIGKILEDGKSRSLVHQEISNTAASCSDEVTVTNAGEDPVDNADSVKLLDFNTVLSPYREVQDVPDSRVPELQDAKETLSENTTKHITDIKEHFDGQQRLLTSMNLLQKELERLKNDNLAAVIPLDDHHIDPALQGLQSDLSQLDKANEHLESISPISKELPFSGNALERVLALELELAEALKAKNRDMRMQSSFLKQHNDKEAVFKSFRDINELIKDMLELKKRNTAVETELKEMQGRYSQLSLKFAEVEGERQQLVMTIKNRSPRKS